MTQLMVLSEAKVYIFRGRGVFIDVYKTDDKIATSDATSLADIDLWRAYRAIDNVATGRIPSLFCAIGVFSRNSFSEDVPIRILILMVNL